MRNLGQTVGTVAGRRLAALAVPLIMAVACASASGSRQQAPRPSKDESRDNQIMVLLRSVPQPLWMETYSMLAKAHDLSGVGAWVMKSIDAPCVVYELPPRADAASIVASIGRDHRVQVAQRVQTFEVLAQPMSYNDPYHHLQRGAKSIRADGAHRWATGRGVRVAVVDTGVAIAHPELEGRVVVAQNFVDRGGASFTQDVHGTSVVGIIAAAANNDVGIVGIAPDAEILALKACWPRPDGTGASCNSYTLALAIDFALTQEIDVLNLSLSGPRDPILERLILSALEGQIVVVAARDERGPEASPFPASVEGVLSLGSAGALSIDSSARRGLVAPAVDVLTTVPRSSYDFLSGSSFAAAHASGVAALLLEREPDLSPERLLRVLETTARPLDLLGGQGAAGDGVAREGDRGDGPLLIDACAAVADLVGQQGCPETALADSDPAGADAQ